MFIELKDIFSLKDCSKLQTNFDILSNMNNYEFQKKSVTDSI